MTVSPVKRPSSRTAVRSVNDGFASATAANFIDRIDQPAHLVLLNTAVATAAAWSFHGSKNAPAPDWAIVGAISDSFA